MNLSRHRFAALVATLTAVAACRGTTWRRYEFDQPIAALPGGGEISLIVVGKSRSADSAGMLLEVTGSPYRIGIFVEGRRPGEITVNRIELAAVTTGQSIVRAVPPLVAQADSTFYANAGEAALPFEDHRVTVYLTESAGKETVQLMLRKRYEERYIPFLEWVKGL